MNIVQSIKDDNLFRPFLGERLSSWRQWLIAIRVLYGLPVSSEFGQGLISTCTGRQPELLPEGGFSTALFLTGRRSGKSRTAAIIGAYEAVLAGNERKLAKGERGVVVCSAPTRRQGKIVKDYLRAIFDVPMLAQEVVAETQWGFELANGNLVEVMAGHYRTIRGYTLLAAIIEEAAFFGLDEESKVRSDTELVRAIRPGLATTGGKLVAISSPYAKRGWTYSTWERNWANEGGRTLVWRAPSRTMNPTLRQQIIDDALAEDHASARSEYLAEWREDVAAFLPREVIEALVIPNRKELTPQPRNRYVAFADLSGGRNDDAALAIAHREGRKVVIDLLRRFVPPFDPYAVVGLMAADVQRFGVRTVIGDNYAAEFVARAFQSNGVRYEKHKKNKSVLYSELLPRLCSGEIELTDDVALVSQLASLERRTRSGGKDIIDHSPGGHDDLANAVAGVADVAGNRLPRRRGAIRSRYAQVP